MPTMTDRQTEIHQYMLEHQRTKGYPPTVREIGVEFGIKSPNGVLCSLKALVKKGRAKKIGDISRGCTAVDPTRPTACAACGHAPPNAEALKPMPPSVAVKILMRHHHDGNTVWHLDGDVIHGDGGYLITVDDAIDAAKQHIRDDYRKAAKKLRDYVGSEEA